MSDSYYSTNWASIGDSSDVYLSTFVDTQKWTLNLPCQGKCCLTVD